MMCINTIRKHSAYALLIILLLLYLFSSMYMLTEEIEDAERDTSPDIGDAIYSNQPIKYMRCPGFHLANRKDGLNVMKKKLLGYLGEILCIEKERWVLMPPLLNHGDLLNLTDGEQRLLPFDAVFDLEVLNRFTYPIRLVADRLPSRDWSYEGLNQDQEVEYTFRDTNLGNYTCKRMVDNLPQKITCPAETAELRHLTAIKSLITIAGRERALDAIYALQPAPKLKKVADYILSSNFPQGRESFMCLHLRTEDDFKTYVNEPPGFYSEQQYYQKLKYHMSKNPQIYKNIQHLFIAGDHSADHINFVVRPLFGPLFSGNIVGHDSMLSSRYATLENIQRAMIDQHICAQANIFLGNIYSGFTQLTLVLRKAMYRNSSLENTKDFLINNYDDNNGTVYDEMMADFKNITVYDLFS